MATLFEREFELYLREHKDPRNKLCHRVGIPTLIVTGVAGLAMLDWRVFVGGQVVGWFFQLLGHRFEKNRPAFLSRPISIVMGPLMVVIELLELVGMRFTWTERARRAATAG
jgi:uncharacterized membrane protein YGL010W